MHQRQKRLRDPSKVPLSCKAIYEGFRNERAGIRSDGTQKGTENPISVFFKLYQIRNPMSNPVSVNAWETHRKCKGKYNKGTHFRHSGELPSHLPKVEGARDDDITREHGSTLCREKPHRDGSGPQDDQRYGQPHQIAEGQQIPKGVGEEARCLHHADLSSQYANAFWWHVFANHVPSESQDLTLFKPGPHILLDALFCYSS